MGSIERAKNGKYLQAIELLGIIKEPNNELLSLNASARFIISVAL